MAPRLVPTCWRASTRPRHGVTRDRIPSRGPQHLAAAGWPGALARVHTVRCARPIAAGRRPLRPTAARAPRHRGPRAPRTRADRRDRVADDVADGVARHSAGQLRTSAARSARHEIMPRAGGHGNVSRPLPCFQPDARAHTLRNTATLVEHTRHEHSTPTHPHGLNPSVTKPSDCGTRQSTQTPLLQLAAPCPATPRVVQRPTYRTPPDCASTSTPERATGLHPAREYTPLNAVRSCYAMLSQSGPCAALNSMPFTCSASRATKRH